MRWQWLARDWWAASGHACWATAAMKLWCMSADPTRDWGLCTEAEASTWPSATADGKPLNGLGLPIRSGTLPCPFGAAGCTPWTNADVPALRIGRPMHLPVSRAGLNRILVEAAERMPNVTFQFDHRCHGYDTAETHATLHLEHQGEALLWTVTAYLEPTGRSVRFGSHDAERPV